MLLFDLYINDNIHTHSYCGIILKYICQWFSENFCNMTRVPPLEIWCMYHATSLDLPPRYAGKGRHKSRQGEDQMLMDKEKSLLAID